jgi:hypothetical protein
MTLQLADIRREWDRLKPHIERLHARIKPEWRPEDVFAECAHQKAFLYLSEEGFLIVQPITDAYSLEQYMHVWIGLSYDGRIGEGMALRYSKELEELARANGYRRITFESPRAGWLRRLKPLSGWGVRSVIYERRLA